MYMFLSKLKIIKNKTTATTDKVMCMTKSTFKFRKKRVLQWNTIY